MGVRLRALLFAAVLAVIGAGCGVRGESAPLTTTAERTTPAVTEAEAVFGGPENAVPNPSFEGGLEYWKPWGLNSKVQAVATDAIDGRSAAKVSAKDVVPYGIESEALVGYPEASDRYTLSVSVRSERGRKTVTLRIAENGGRFNSEAVAERQVRVGPRWRDFSIDGRVRRDDRLNVNVYLFVLRSIRRGDAFFVDGVTLVRTPRGEA